MDHHAVITILLLLVVSAGLVALCYRIGLSAIIGYLISGLLLGPYVAGVLDEPKHIQLFAEAGVVLLMFTIGLQFSLTRLLAAKKLVLGVGGAQVTSITLLGSLVFLGLGVQPVLAVILGGGIAMSSTAITLKQLGEQGELGMVHGKVATGILLFQDVAAIPFLVLLPLLGNGGPGQEEALWLTLARAAAVFLILVMLGRHLLPRLLHWVAGTHSLELFMLVVLTLALGAAALTLLAGLSATLGAFMAGMLLGETRFRYQIEADIRPFRDLMLGVFFISIGMRLDPAILMDEPGAILLVLAALIMVKALLMTLLVRGFGYDWFESARSAVVLAQGGEFGLLLVAQVIAIGGVQSEFLQPVLAGLIISMLIAPVLIRLNHPLAQLLTGRPPGRLETDRLDNLAETTEGMQEHVILCGYGHLGQGIARILREQDIEALAIDNDPERVRELREEDEPVVFGDAANATILELARIHQARAVAITFDDEEKARLVITQVYRLSPAVPVIARSRHGWKETEKADQNLAVVNDQLESSLVFARELLIMCGLEPDLVDRTINLVRAQEYVERNMFRELQSEAEQNR